MDTRIEEISKIIDELSTTQALWLKGLKDKIKYHLDDDFDGEGEDIGLPTIDEALKLKEENEKLKKEIEKLKKYPFGITYSPSDESIDESEIQRVCDHFNNCLKMMKEENEKIKEAHCNAEDKAFHLFTENRELKKQIPDKKGKKLSPNDKEVLKRIRDSIQPGPDDVCGKEEYKLLNRLSK